MPFATQQLTNSNLQADPDFTFNLEDNEGVSDFFVTTDIGSLGTSIKTESLEGEHDPIFTGLDLPDP